VGQKRFSLEGGESFIAAMDELIQPPAPRACRKS
jgi:2-oxoglutarate dehydrogenase complex dehydrogenase (E1) component-like enzyme